jgi:hypothetical protein
MGGWFDGDDDSLDGSSDPSPADSYMSLMKLESGIVESAAW